MTGATQAQLTDLLAAAREAREVAYAPYSRFAVGAAVLMADGRIVAGANVENASYPLSVCAERTAIQRAVTVPGSREIVAVAVVSSSGAQTWPCGGCRQVINEFGPEATIVTEHPGALPVTRELPDLLPDAFGPQDLPT